MSNEKSKSVAAPQIHWADRAAAEIEAGDRAPVLSTGISPSGEIHIGNMREVLTADAVFRALKERGSAVEFNYVADNFDPLRRVYPFLDESTYAPMVGRPLSEIPCPCGDHDSYSEHFLQPFLEALKRLQVDVRVERADLMYKSGRMTPYIIKALEGRDRIAAILEELTGKRSTAEWSPFNVLCPTCERMTDAQATGFSSENESVEYRCKCGSAGSVPMAGGGKLVWRVDWPARWAMLGVTVEPFGKDHATRGGSYDTGKRLAREIFGLEPPFPIAYEWIRLKGKGDMSSSRGNVLSISRMLEVVPPEVLRYLVIRERPTKTINFDPGIPLLQLVDEMDDSHSTRRDPRAVALSQAGTFVAVGVPFKHLIVVAQTARFDVDRAVEILHRTGYADVQREAVAGRIEYARRWLESFAPEELKFEVQESVPQQAAELSDEQRAFLRRLAGQLDASMDGAAIHALVYELAGEFSESKPAQLFQAIYVSLLGKERGPRAGAFLSVLGTDFAARRFSEVAGRES